MTLRRHLHVRRSEFGGYVLVESIASQPNAIEFPSTVTMYPKSTWLVSCKEEVVSAHQGAVIANLYSTVSWTK